MGRLLIICGAVLLLMLAKKGPGYRYVLIMAVAVIIVTVFGPVFFSDYLSGSGPEAVSEDTGQTTGESQGIPQGKDSKGSPVKTDQSSSNQPSQSGSENSAGEPTPTPYNTGLISIRVRQTKATSVVDTVYGFHYNASDKKGRYIWLLVSAVNQGNTAVRVSPDDFTLSAPDGYKTVRNEATFAQRYFKPVKLSPQKSNEGWLIFFMPGGNRYTLQYYGAGGSAFCEVERISANS